LAQALAQANSAQVWRRFVARHNTMAFVRNAARQVLSDWLQPVDSLVERPPLRKSISFSVMIPIIISALGGVVGIMYFAYTQSLLTSYETLDRCKIDLGSDCRDITRYPVSMDVGVHAGTSAVLTLTKYMSSGDLIAAFERMRCQVAEPDEDVLYSWYDQNIITQPIGFKWKCTDSVTGAALVPSWTLGSSIAEFVAALSRRKSFMWPTSGFGVSGVRLSAVVAKSLQLQFYVTLADNTLISSTSSIDCKNTAAGYSFGNFVRDCSYGPPHEHVKQGATALTSVNAGTVQWPDANCTLEQGDNRLIQPSELVRSVAPQVVVIGTGIDWGGHTRTAQNFPDYIAKQLCKKSGIMLGEQLNGLESFLGGRRDMQEIFTDLAKAIEAQCPYTFECRMDKYQNFFVWLSIASPMLITLRTIIATAGPILYEKIARVAPKGVRKNAADPEAPAEAVA